MRFSSEITIHYYPKIFISATWGSYRWFKCDFAKCQKNDLLLRNLKHKFVSSTSLLNKRAFFVDCIMSSKRLSNCDLSSLYARIQVFTYFSVASFATYKVLLITVKNRDNFINNIDYSSCGRALEPVLKNSIDLFEHHSYKIECWKLNAQEF